MKAVLTNPPVGEFNLGPTVFCNLPAPLYKGPPLILFKGRPVEGPAGRQRLGAGKRAKWEQVRGDVKRHPEVRVMTALLGEVTAERHFSRRAEREKHKPKVHIQHNNSSSALRCWQRNTLPHAHNLSATRSKGGSNPSGNAL